MKKKIGYALIFILLYALFYWGVKIWGVFFSIADNFYYLQGELGDDFSRGCWLMIILPFITGCIGLLLIALEIWFDKLSWKLAKSIYLIGLAAVTLICISMGYGFTKKQAKFLPAIEAINNKITLEELEKAMENGEEEILYITRTGCEDCIYMTDQIYRLIYETGIKLKHYDTYADRNERSEEVNAVFTKYNITTVPVLLVLKEGEIVKRFEGEQINKAVDYFTNQPDIKKETVSEKDDIEEQIKESEEQIFSERIVYETAADLTHDGIDDLVRVIVAPDDAGLSTEKLLKGTAFAVIKIYQGTDTNQYETEPCYESRAISTSHAGNGQLFLTEKDGKDYLITTSIYEGQGVAIYSYEIIYLNHGEAVTEAYDDIEFFTDNRYIENGWDVENPVYREDAVPAFKETLMPWLENAIILAALDVNTPIFLSTSEKTYPASEYFNLVWERGDAAD